MTSNINSMLFIDQNRQVWQLLRDGWNLLSKQGEFIMAKKAKKKKGKVKAC